MNRAGGAAKRFWLRLWTIGDPLFWQIFGCFVAYVAYAFTRLLSG